MAQSDPILLRWVSVKLFQYYPMVHKVSQVYVI